MKMPVPAARRTDHQAEPSVEYRHHVCAPGTWIRLSGGRNRLVQPQGAQLAHQQEHGSGVLCGLPGRRVAHVWEAGNIQQRPRIAIHERRLHERFKRDGIAISMDGRGRAFDNIFVERLWRSVKHEDIYLNGYRNMGE